VSGRPSTIRSHFPRHPHKLKVTSEALNAGPKSILAEILGVSDAAPRSKATVIEAIVSRAPSLRLEEEIAPGDERGADAGPSPTAAANGVSKPTLPPGLGRVDHLMDATRRLNKDQRRMHLALDLITEMAHVDSHPDLFAVLHTGLRSLLGARGVRLFRATETALAVIEKDEGAGAGGGAEPHGRPGTRARVTGLVGIVGFAASTGETVATDDSSAHFAYDESVDGHVSKWTPMIAVPLGVAAPDEFTEEAAAPDDAAAHASPDAELVPPVQTPAHSPQRAAGVLQITGKSADRGGKPWTELELVLVGWVSRAAAGQFAAISRRDERVRRTEARAAEVDATCAEVISKAAACIAYPPKIYRLGQLASLAATLPHACAATIWQASMPTVEERAARSHRGSATSSDTDGESGESGEAQPDAGNAATARARARWTDPSRWSGGQASPRSGAWQDPASVRPTRAAAVLADADEGATRLTRDLGDGFDEALGASFRTHDHRHLVQRARRTTFLAAGVHRSERVVVEMRCADGEPRRVSEAFESAVLFMIARCAALVLQQTGDSSEEQLQRRHRARQRWLVATHQVAWKATRTRLALQERKIREDEEVARGMHNRSSLLLESAAILASARNETPDDMRERGESGGPSLTTLARRIMQHAEKNLVVDRTSLFLFEPATLELHAVYSTGLDRQIVVSVRGGKAQRAGLAAAAIATDSTVVTSDAYTHSWFNSSLDRDTGYRTKSVVVIPLRATDGDVIGVMQLINKKEYTKRSQETIPFSLDDVVVAEALATQIALTIEIIRTKRQALNAVELLKKDSLLSRKPSVPHQQAAKGEGT